MENSSNDEKSEENQENDDKEFKPKQDEAPTESQSNKLIFPGFVKVSDVSLKAEDFRTLSRCEKLEDNILLFFLEWVSFF